MSREGNIRRPPVIAVAAAIVCALAAWVSLGVMAVTGDAASPRVGILPGWWVPAGAAALLLVLGCWRRVPESAWRPALIPFVLLLPWLPFPVPAAFLAWTGPVVRVVWAATVLSVAIVVARSLPRRAAAQPTAARSSAWREGWLVFASSLAVYAVAAWTSAGLRPIGDEPQYLIITQSILLDHDIRIENNHAREDYVAYYTADLKPDYLRRGRNGQIYSIHAPGLPALVAPAFAVGGYPGVVVFLLLVSAAGAWLAWRTSYRLAGDAGAARFGWAVAALTVPFLCHSGAVFPDGPSAVLVLTGVAALVRLDRAPSDTSEPMPFFLHGAALALLPWLHTRAAAAAGVLGACVALRLIQARRWRQLAAFAAAPVVGAAGWFGFFYVVYGSFDPSSPYRSYSQSSAANVVRGLPALLFDQEYGILPNAPVYAIAFAGLAMLFRHRLRLAIELAVLVLAYLATVASYAMWWGGWSAPARFAVAVLPALGPCAALFWARGGRIARAGAAVALAVSLAASAIVATVDGGRVMLNAREGAARWIEWLCPAVDLPRGLPSFFRGGVLEMLGDAAVWAAMMLAAWLALRLFARRAVPFARSVPAEQAPPSSVSSLAVAAPLLFAAAVMVAASVVWEVRGAEPVTPTSAQLRLMSSFDPAALPLAIQYRPLRIRPASDLPGRLRVSASERRPRARKAPPLVIRDLPAGTYRLLRPRSGTPTGDLDVRVFKSPLAIQRCSFETLQPQDCILHVPVTTVELRVGSPLPGAASVAGERRAIELQPIDLLAARERPTTEKATAAARYGAFAAFAFDETVFLEPTGLWVTGGVDTPLVLASDEARRSVTVLLRNGARENRVHLAGGAFTLDVTFAPREEREVSLPLDARSRTIFLRVRAEHGFRPSETDPGSRDTRYLGVWIEVASGQATIS